MHLYLRYVPAADRHDPELSLETETRVEDEIAVLLPMLISSCQGGPTRTEVAEAGVGAVKHCQDIKDAGATCWGAGSP